MQANIDSQLVGKIVHEVKSKGLFDKFRKDSMADVDTKPAYQNLRLRVENTVNKFLTEQSWSPDTNKNQLRERLRKHITEAGFLDIGVERIVDQVVNPKIATVFQPQIEDIAYKYLGVEKPERKPLPPQTMFNGHLEIKTDLLLTDLEQVSPDSDKLTNKSDSFMDIDEKVDDFESPAFEPLTDETNISSKVSEERLVPPGEESPPAPPGTEDFVIEENETNNSLISGISNLTSQNSVSKAFDEETDKMAVEKSVKTEALDVENISAEISQESQLSQVSSNSRLSIVSNDTEEETTITREVKEESNVNISEEAQMPKFNENSNSNLDKNSEPLHFDIKKDEIIFEGTERRGENHQQNISPNINEEQLLNESDDKQTDLKPVENEDKKIIDDQPKEDDDEIPRPALFSDNFSFSKININPPEYLNSTDSKTLEDSIGKELRIIEQSDSETIPTTEVSMQAQNLSQSGCCEDPKIQSVESSIKSVEDLKSPSPIPSGKSTNGHKIKSPNSSARSKDRDHGRYSSSSLSRHKKHSKDKRSDRDKDRERSSSSKSDSRKQTSSSDRKHSSSHRQSSQSSTLSSSSRDGKEHKTHRISSSSHRSKHSSRDEKPKSDERKSKQSNNKHQDKKEKDRNENQSRPSNDDHYSSKQKMNRKKSTDSNDGDSQNCPKKESTNPSDLNNSERNTSVKSNESSPNTSRNDSNGPTDTLLTNTEQTVFSKPSTVEIVQMNSKPVILDDLLTDPNTKFIEMCSTSVHVKSEILAEKQSEESLELTDGELEEYDEEDGTLKKLQEKMSKLNEKIIDCRKKQYSIIFKHNKEEEPKSPIFNTNSSQNRKRKIESTVTSATLTIDCIQYNNIDNLNKKFSFVATSGTKISPTISETSLGSKENECTEKNVRISPIDSTNKSKQMDKRTEKRNSIANQRYSSDDLYKPRTVLSQRSKRRGLDAEDT